MSSINSRRNHQKLQRGQLDPEDLELLVRRLGDCLSVAVLSTMWVVASKTTFKADLTGLRNSQIASPPTAHEEPQDRRRASLSLSTFEEENVLAQSADDWAFVSKIVSKYSLLSVCAGHYLEDGKSLKSACVESDLLVVRARWCLLRRVIEKN